MHKLIKTLRVRTMNMQNNNSEQIRMSEPEEKLFYAALKRGIYRELAAEGILSEELLRKLLNHED